MNLRSKRELEVTREKLRLVEQRYDAIRAEPSVDDHVQELTLRSLKGLMNQLKEEIARFEGRAAMEAETP